MIALAKAQLKLLELLLKEPAGTHGDHGWFRPGPCAPASGGEMITQLSRPTDPDTARVQRPGREHGDHHTCVRNPGQPMWTADHQPPTGILKRARESKVFAEIVKKLGIITDPAAEQKGYAHSEASRLTQGPKVRNVLQKADMLEMIWEHLT